MLVTGGSRGIGRGAAIGLAQAGADVAINYHSHPEEAESAVDEIHRLGRKSLMLQADVANNEAVEERVGRVVGEFDGSTSP